MSRKRILFIDGDDGFVREVATSLHRSGFDAVLAASSTDGVERARQDRPDLIVVNVELAPTNGWSVCTKLKKDDDLKGIPIVLTSSTSTPDTFEKHKKLKTRADEYLLKPYETSDLIRVAGSLVGLPDVPAEQEDLVVEDESLSSGDFDMSGLDEEIPIADDEPLHGEHVNGTTGLETPSSEPLDPLEGAQIPEEPLAEEPLAAEPLAADGLGSEPLAAEGLEDIHVEAEASQPPASAQEDDLIAFDESFANLATAEGTATTEGDALAEFSDDQLVTVSDENADPLAAEPLGDVGFADDISFDEAPLESPSEHAAPSAETSLESEFQADGFGAALAPVDDSRVAALEAHIAQLEAEIEGYRATEHGRDQELERLREEAAQKDQESEDLRTQVLQRDKTIRELKEADSKSKAELAKVADERTRREAVMKSLTQKAEQISATARKFEREAAAAREDAKGIPALKARIAELEQAQQDGQAQAATAREQFEALQRDHDSLKAEHTQATSDLESARSEATDTKQQLDQSQEAARQAQAQLEELRQQLEQSRSETEQARSETEQARQEAAASSSAAAQSKETAEQSAKDLEASRSDLASVRQQLEESQRAAEKAQREASELRAQLTSAEDRLKALTGQVQVANDRAAKAREALRQAVEHLAHEPS